MNANEGYWIAKELALSFFFVAAFLKTFKIAKFPRISDELLHYGTIL
jgi:hypothetical protein